MRTFIYADPHYGHDAIIKYESRPFDHVEHMDKALIDNWNACVGKHDRGHSLTWWKNTGFEEVYEHPICYGGFYWFSHEPMYVNSHMPYVNVHGHIHGQKYEGEQYVNVSVEHTDYAPVLFEVIANRFLKEVEDESF